MADGLASVQPQSDGRTTRRDAEHLSGSFLCALMQVLGMGNVLDLAEVVAQDVDPVAPAHAALAASWSSLVNTVTHNSAESLTDWIKTGGGTEKD